MYSPKIREDLVRRLYELKQKKKKSMTHLISEALTQYLDKEEDSTVTSKNPSK